MTEQKTPAENAHDTGRTAAKRWVEMPADAPTLSPGILDILYTIQQASEAVEAFNSLTAEEGWAEEPDDVQLVSTAFLRLFQGLPRSLDRVTAELDRLDQANAIRVDNGEEPGVATARVIAALQHTRAQAAMAGNALTTATQGLTHLAPGTVELS